ncbi:MAG: L-glutamate gamma-semialdehyde dehydrogenase [Hyphomicrobiales bacterium]
MNNANYRFQLPKNEPVKPYTKGSEERRLLNEELERQKNIQVEIPIIIGGKEIKTGDTGNVVMPHDHGHVLGTYHKAGAKEVQMAVQAAMEAKEKWANLPYEERAAVMLKVGELIATKYRYVMNAATMLGQSKTPHQAEIEAACETIDFLRFNCTYASQIYSDQPLQLQDHYNRVEYRPLEGFVFVVSPFNFTAIAANLNASPVLMGNTTVWKPATTSILSSYYLMKIFQEAGVPDGVINFVPGTGRVIGGVCLTHPDLGGIHFTGSNGTFNHMWRTIGENLETYKSYPKLVGETGGKDFVVAHHSAPAREVATGLVRGAFEYQGQKCSAASRAYIPQGMWNDVKEHMGEMLGRMKMGDICDYSTFMGAVIDESSFDNITKHIDIAKESADAEILFGGGYDKSKGYFIEPTVIVAKDPKFVTMEEELFGPVITIYIYEDDKYEEVLDLCDKTSIYALTGAIFAKDRYALQMAYNKLRYAAGNFYFNDKPTGAVVGQQPFGGSRGSGTNDKAGSYMNLIRWTNPRTIKEVFVSPTDFVYPYLDQE